MQILTIQHFAGAANQSFDLRLGEAGHVLTLIEVRPLPPHPFPGMRREPFSLLFKSASQLILPQRLYHLRHATMGALELFLVPIARDPSGTVYQAMFN